LTWISPLQALVITRPGFLLPVPSAARSRSATARVNLTAAEPAWGDKKLPNGEHLGLTAKRDKSPLASRLHLSRSESLDRRVTWARTRLTADVRVDREGKKENSSLTSLVPRSGLPIDRARTVRDPSIFFNCVSLRLLRVRKSIKYMSYTLLSRLASIARLHTYVWVISSPPTLSFWSCLQN
jgi:hypothetical protein